MLHDSFPSSPRPSRPRISIVGRAVVVHLRFRWSNRLFTTENALRGTTPIELTVVHAVSRTLRGPSFRRTGCSSCRSCRLRALEPKTMWLGGACLLVSRGLAGELPHIVHERRELVPPLSRPLPVQIDVDTLLVVPCSQRRLSRAGSLLQTLLLPAASFHAAQSTLKWRGRRYEQRSGAPQFD